MDPSSPAEQSCGNIASDARELLRVLVDEAHDYGIIVLDRSGCIERWNLGAAVLFGHEPQDVIGRHFSLLFTLEDVRAETPERELERAATEGSAADQRWHVRGDGTRFYCDGVTTRLRSGGAVTGFVKLVRDATLLKQAEEERQRLLIREQQLNREKDDFLAAVSHELRTPLTTITGWVALLERNTDSEEVVRDGVANVKHATAALAKLVDDLLDSVRARTSKMRVECEPTDLTKVTRSAVHALQVATDEKRLTVKLSVASGVFVYGDPTRLQQVIWNLLSNAVRHSHPGSAIDVALRIDGDDAELEVRDDGDGIDPALLPYIFEPFRQHARCKGGGLGLGLAIAKTLVELHGGTVAAQSDGVGRGAAFRIRLPLLHDGPGRNADGTASAAKTA